MLWSPADTPDEWAGHLLMLYRSEDERRAAVAAWVRRGLELGEKVVYVRRADEDPAILPSLLTQYGVAAGQALKDGQICILGPEEFYPADGQRDVIERALAEGHPGVRVTREVCTGLGQVGPQRHGELEAEAEELSRRLPVAAMCQHGLSDGADLAAHLGAHPHAVRDAQLWLHAENHDLTLRGDVDLANSDLLLAVLEAATTVLGPGETFTVDLRDIGFIDVRGCRSLLLGTDAFRAGGGSLVLRGPREPVRRTLRLLGVTRQPRVSLTA